VARIGGAKNGGKIEGGYLPPIAGAGGNPGGITEILDIFSFDQRNIRKLIN
jgi:hypothetical protein